MYNLHDHIKMKNYISQFLAIYTKYLYITMYTKNIILINLYN